MTTTTPRNSDNEKTVDVTAAVPITITIDPTELLKASNIVTGYDEDGGPVYSSDTANAIVEAIARRAVTRDNVSTWAVSESVKKAIDARIAVLVDEALTARWTPTTRYGQPTGAETSLEDEIRRELKRWLTHQPSNDRYDRDKTPCLQTYLAATVDSVAKKDMDEALKSARQEVTLRLKDQAASALADTIQRIARGL